MRFIDVSLCASMCLMPSMCFDAFDVFDELDTFDVSRVDEFLCVSISI
jgi:hypothetical protein